MDKTICEDELRLAVKRGKSIGQEAIDNFTTEEREFLVAIDRFKRLYSRPHPSWLEVLAIIRTLGYSRSKLVEPKQVSEVPHKRQGRRAKHG